jgi:uncharacterized iron-regulated membrane protein
LNPLDAGIADSEDADHTTRHAMPRVIASLVFAFFAYLGLALGGGFGAIANDETNSFSAGKNNQPLYQPLRDTARGILASERKSDAGSSWHGGNDVLVPAQSSLFALNLSSQPRDHVRAPRAALLPFRAYVARAPPASA